MNKNRYSWFEKFLATIWLIGIISLGIGVNHAFITEIRDLHGKIGLLKRPTTPAIEWQVDNLVKAMLQPVNVDAQSAVVCVGGCLSNETYLASRASEKAEVTLLRTIITAFVRTILNFIQNFITNIIKQLASAQSQFNFLKTIGQYAEQALLLASNQAFNCANQSASTWAYSLFGETPPNTTNNSCKFGATTVTNPTSTQVVGASQAFLEQCAVLNLSSVKPSGCTQSQIQDIQNQRDEVIKAKVLSQCNSSYTPPLYSELVGAYSCSDAVLAQINAVRQQSDARIALVTQNASSTYSKFQATAGTDAPFISSTTTTTSTFPTANNTSNTDVSASSTTPTISNDSTNPVFFPTSLDIFDPNSQSTNTLQIGFVSNPDAVNFTHQYAIAALNSKPQPSGSGDSSIISLVQDTFKNFLNALTQQLQTMLFSFLNSLVAKLNLAAGGSGLFSSLLSDVTGAVNTYAKTQINNLYKDVNTQRLNYINNLTTKKPVITNSTQDIINSNVAFIA
jgi:hypothetical protein